MSAAAATAVLLAVAVLLLSPPGIVAPRRVNPHGRWWMPLAGAAALLLQPGHWTVLVLILACSAWGGRALWTKRAEVRQTGETGGRVVEICDLIAAELASGRPAQTTLAEAARAWPALRPVADVGLLGGDVPTALRQVALLPGADGLRLLAGAWAVSHRTGAGLAQSARRVSDAVRRDLATQRVVAGELASARATSRLVALLPILALLMGSGAGADPWSFLLTTPLGLACLAGGLVMGFAGLWWIELIARDVG